MRFVFTIMVSLTLLVGSLNGFAEAFESSPAFSAGQEHFRNRDFRQAVASFEVCLEKHPESADVMCWLAKSLAYQLGELGKQGESRFSLLSKGKRIYDLYQEAYKIDPQNPHAKLGYAILKRDLPTMLLGGDLEKAEDLFMELLESDPQNVLASYHLGKLYLVKKDNFEMGMRFMKRSLAMVETKELNIEEELYLSNIHHAIGKAYIENDQPDEALPYLTNSIELEDGSVPTLIDLARVYTLTKSEEEATKYLKRAITISKEREYTFFDDDMKSIAKDLGIANQVDI